MTDVSIAERHARIVLLAMTLAFAVSSMVFSLILPVELPMRPMAVIVLAALTGYGVGHGVRLALKASFMNLLRRSRLRVRATNRSLGSDARNRQLILAGYGFSFSTPVVLVDEADRVYVPPMSIASFPDRTMVALVAGSHTYLLTQLSDGRIVKTTNANPRDLPIHPAVELNLVRGRQPAPGLITAHQSRLGELAASGLVPNRETDPIQLVELDEYYEQVALKEAVAAA